MRAQAHAEQRALANGLGVGGRQGKRGSDMTAPRATACQWAFACVRSRAFAVTDKRADPATPAVHAPALGAREGNTEEKRDVFVPSAAAVAEAKAAAKQSGGLCVCVRACVWCARGALACLLEGGHCGARCGAARTRVPPLLHSVVMHVGSCMCAHALAHARARADAGFAMLIPGKAADSISAVSGSGARDAVALEPADASYNEVMRVSRSAEQEQAARRERIRETSTSTSFEHVCCVFRAHTCQPALTRVCTRRMHAQEQFAFVPFLDMLNHDAAPNADFRLAAQPRSLMYLFGAARIPTRVGTRMHDTCPGAQLRGRAVHLTSAGSDRRGLRGTDLVSSANVQSHLPGLFPFPTAPDAYPPSSSRVSGALRADSVRVLREECRRVRGRA